MNDPDRLSKDLLNKAAFWLIHKESGRLSPGEKQQFEKWISAKPEHLIAFEEMKTLSSGMGALTAKLEQDEDKEASGLKAETLKAAALVNSHRRKKHKNFIRRRKFGVLAAAVFLVALLGALLWQTLFLHQETGLYQTAIGEQKTVMLSDGSVITLNTDSEISVALTDTTRRLHLKRGEAYFEVAKDANRPFEVVVRNAFVRAVGTAFNISRRDHEVAVIVTEGQVEVKSNFTPLPYGQKSNLRQKDKEILLAGDQIIFGEEKRERIRLNEQTIGRKILWREGKIILDEISLHDIIRQIQPYISERIVIANDDISDLTAGGVFKVGEMDSFFNALEVALPVRIIRKEGVIILTKRSATET